MGSQAQAKKGYAALGVCAVGLIVSVVALQFLPTQVPQWAFALAAGILLALANLIDEGNDSAALLSACCACLGFFLGWGVGAAVSTWRLASSSGGEWLTVANTYAPVPLFLVLVTLFHIIEFAFVVCFHPKDTRYRALMMTPVPGGAYSIALIAALIEFYAESWLWPLMPSFVGNIRLVLLVVGFTISFAGWAFRSVALFTAQSNFTHLVASRKTAKHQLVTQGVYRLCRHPGYVGWFLWSVGTQLMMGNPLCFAAYFGVSFMFFKGRIPGEEAYLVEFFGEQYLRYAERVPCGIPGISNLG